MQRETSFLPIWLHLADPAVTGRAVLAALDAGRTRAIEAKKAEAVNHARLVRRLLDVDILAGHGQRGRAERISAHLPKRQDCNGNMKPLVCARTVRNILARLFSDSDSTLLNGSQSKPEIS
jgi:hypothetical protein